MTTSAASIVIPAHDEESVIARTLNTILENTSPGEFEVVVVCNGCSDRTEEISLGFADRGVQTISIEIGSKIAALNAGDQVVRAMPRLYVDADVRITADSIRRLVATLNAGALAAAPRAELDLTDSSPLVRSYFKVWRRLGHVSRGLGSGVYALSAEGRSRFSEFPDVIADDYFVYCMVGGDERVSPVDAISIVEQPRTITDLAKRRLRVEKGNAQLRERGISAASAGAGLVDIVKDSPVLLPNAMLYAGIHLWARQRISRMSAAQVGWQRDESTRGVQRDA